MFLTNLIIFRGKGGEQNDYYTLETLYFFIKHKDLKYTAYLQKTTVNIKIFEQM